MQTLLTIASQPEGALEMLRIEDSSPLAEIATQYPLTLEIFSYSWTNASTISTEIPTVRESIDRTIPTLIVVFKQTDAVTLIECLGSFLPKLESEVRFWTHYTNHVNWL